MSATPNDTGDGGQETSQTLCNCPICSGQGLDALVSQASSTAGSGPAAAGALSPLTALPALNSRAGCAYTLVLDFNGSTTGTWGSFTNVSTPVYDIDGDATTFSAQEIANIQEIWARVAEDYAPFNINVTTVDPGNLTNGRTLKVAIGGSCEDWYGSSAGGVSYINSFTNSITNVAFAFTAQLGNGNARYTAEAVSHEAGHAFGLLHHSTYNGTTKTAEYNQGTASLAPIMGVSYYATVTTWNNGANSTSSTTFQDDMAILAGSTNGFGYRADDHANSTTGATAFTRSGNNLSGSGVVAQNNDVDYFSFTTAGGNVSFSVNVASIGANLDAIVELRNSSGTVIVSANPTGTLGASLSASVEAGTYYVSVHSTGAYGNVGQYTVTGTAPAASAPSTSPEITILQGTTNMVDDSSSVSFGSTNVGTAVTKTFTVKNDGDATLTLTQLVAGNMPAGFTLVSGFGSTTLAAGASTTFSVKLSATAAGTFSGALIVTSNDASEGSFAIQLTGTVATAVTKKIIDNGATGFSTVGTWTAISNAGRDADALRVAKGTGGVAATWSFTGLTAGQYKVSATWVNASTNATNSPFTITSGSTVLKNTVVNQRLAPTGLTADGSNWFNLGTVTITGTTLTVKLTNNANGYVSADAIRIEKVTSAGVPAAASIAGGAAVGGATAGSFGGSYFATAGNTGNNSGVTGAVVSNSAAAGSALDATVTDDAPVTDSGDSTPTGNAMNVAFFTASSGSNGATANSSANSTGTSDGSTETDALFASMESQLNALDELAAELADAWA